jgi:hypothetical protein
MNSNHPTGPPYPLTIAHTRIFTSLTQAVQHYCTYQYTRCLMHELPDGRVLMVLHA